MKNNCFELGLHPTNVSPKLHKEFRELYYKKNGSLNRIYTVGISKQLEYVIELFKGNIEIEEIEKIDVLGQITHDNKNLKTSFMRKNERTDLKRFSIHNIDQNLRNEIQHFLIDQYGTNYGSLSYIMNQAMELYIKQEKGQVKIKETLKKAIKNFIDDNNGQISLSEISNLVEAVKTLNLKMDGIENIIEDKVKSTVQSTLKFVQEPVNKVKNVIKGTIKSYRREDKFEKSLKTLENVMRYKEFNFTEKDYHRSLVKLTGQGDMRTVRSDLEMLELDNRVRKMRNNAHGTKTYQFISNDQYHRYNTELAKERFLEGFKEAFQNINALTVDELNGFIFKKDGLHDVQSQHKRLKWLLLDGCVERHEANPKLLFIQK